MSYDDENPDPYADESPALRLAHDIALDARSLVEDKLPTVLADPMHVDAIRLMNALVQAQEVMHEAWVMLATRRLATALETLQ